MNTNIFSYNSKCAAGIASRLNKISYPYRQSVVLAIQNVPRICNEYHTWKHITAGPFPPNGFVQK